MNLDLFGLPSIIDILVFILFIFFCWSIGDFILVKVLTLENEDHLLLALPVGAFFVAFLTFVAGFIMQPLSREFLIMFYSGIWCVLVYFKREWSWRNLFLSLFLLLPWIIFLPALKSRLFYPPFYADEINYQIPSVIYFLNPDYVWVGNWKFDGNLYNMIPRSMNILYEIVIRLTNSYFFIRIFIFSFSATILSSILFLLWRKANKFSALFFITLLFAIPQDLPFEITVANVDFQSSIVATLALLVGIYATIDKNKKLMFLSFCLWGGALGIKYPILIAFLGFLIFLLLYQLKNRENLIKKNIYICAFLTTISGGYWYFKNLIVTGNPIYPMVFPCLGFKNQCLSYKNIFDGWAQPPIKITSFAKINEVIHLLFYESSYVLNLFYLGILLYGWLVISAIKKKRAVSEVYMLTVILLVALFDLLVGSEISGFIVRYFLRVQFWLILFTSLSFGFFVSSIKSYLLKWPILTFFTVYCVLGLLNSVNIANIQAKTYVEPFNYWDNGIKKIISKNSIVLYPVYEWCEQQTEPKVILVNNNLNLGIGSFLFYVKNCAFSFSESQNTKFLEQLGDSKDYYEFVPNSRGLDSPILQIGTAFLVKKIVKK